MKNNNVYYKINLCAESGFCKDFKTKNGLYYWDYRIFADKKDAYVFAKEFFRWPNTFIIEKNNDIIVYGTEGSNVWKKYVIMSLSSKEECVNKEQEGVYTHA